MVIGNPLMIGGGDNLKNAYAIISVEYPVGSTLTCTNGTKTLTAGNKKGFWTFGVPTSGDWTITAVDGDNSTSKTISVEEEKSYNVILSYRLYIIQDGQLTNYAINCNKTHGYNEATGTYLVDGKSALTYVYFNVDEASQKSKIVLDVKAIGGYFGGDGNNHMPLLGISNQPPTNVGNTNTPNGNIAYLKIPPNQYSAWLDDSTFEIEYGELPTGTYYIFLWASYVSNTSGKPSWTSGVGTPYIYIRNWYLE